MASAGGTRCSLIPCAGSCSLLYGKEERGKQNADFFVASILLAALLWILRCNKVMDRTVSLVALNAGLIYTRSRAFSVRRSFFCQHKHSAETTAMTQLPANAA